MAKKYFWLKLKNDFFTQPKIKKAAENCWWRYVHHNLSKNAVVKPKK